MRNQNSHGYFGYDAQWIKIEDKWWYRLDIFDTIRNMPVACHYIIIMNQIKLLKILLKKAYPLKYRKAIITDSKQGYDENNE